MYFLIKVLGKSLYSLTKKVNKWILKVRYFSKENVLYILSMCVTLDWTKQTPTEASSP